MIPEEDQSMMEVLKLSDPSFMQSLMLIKNSSKTESKLSVMLGRARSIKNKYAKIVPQMRIHGVDFIVSTGVVGVPLHLYPNYREHERSSKHHKGKNT